MERRFFASCHRRERHDRAPPLTWVEPALRWYLVVAAISWLVAPLTRWLCASLSDRGATINRPLALLIVVYPAWLLASLGAPVFTSSAIAISAMVIGLVGWIGLARDRQDLRPWLSGLLRVEVASLLLFVAYLWLRGYTPEILGTEKPMDVAMLASSMRTESMPPPDPWFSGEPINYYYLGYLLFGTVGRLASVPPEVGFNLSLATIFSVTAVAAFGVGWYVCRPFFGQRSARVAGLLAAFFLTLSGNLYAPLSVLRNGAATLTAWWWDNVVGIGWRSSRIVCDGPRIGNACQFPSTETINEFPFFSFLLGDLHPHLMALPFTLVVLALAWNSAARYETDRGWWLRIALTGMVAGALFALNSWDLPLYLALTIAVVWHAREGTARTLGPILALSCAVIAWLPFYLTYATPTIVAPVSGASPALPIISRIASTLSVHLDERTSIGEYLTIFGVPFTVGVALVTVGFWNEDPPPLRLLLVAAVATIVPGVLLSAPILPLCGIPLTLAVSQLKGAPAASPRLFALVAFSAAWLISIGVEFFYIRDAFDSRMNTLFKFYYQTWTLSALAAAVTVPILWQSFAEHRWARAMLAAYVPAALVLGLAYPTIASYQWTNHFASWQGLDGLAYGESTDRDDVAAIRWLRDRASPGDVVLEAAGCSYRPFGRIPFNRIAAFTGVPTIIGWGDNHQRQWRAGQPQLIDQITQRQSDVAAMFENPNSPLFDAYSVRWLVVGQYERGDWQSECPTAGPYPGVDASAYPGPGWQEVFNSGETRIYERTGA